MSLTKLLAAAMFAMAAVAPADRSRYAGSDVFVYFGTYTGAKSQGIYVSRLDGSSGALSDPELAGESTNPSFLALHPTQNFLYAVNEIRDGAVTAFAIDRSTGKLTTLNRQSSVGAGPAHLAVDDSGRNVLVANYGGGTVTVLPIGRDGKLKAASAVVQHTGASVNVDRQSQPHPHSINIAPDNRFVYVADLGIDKVLIYRFNASIGSLVPSDPPFASVEAGSGPRHLAFLRGGHFACVINEMSCSITTFRRDVTRGRLDTLETISTLPPGQSVLPGYSSAEIQVHPSGRFLYGSNRGHDSIAVFAVDEKSGTLTYVDNQPSGGHTPRGFGIDPSGRYLVAANQGSDSVVVFQIDLKTGRLRPTGRAIDVGAPVCVTFVASH